MALDSEQLEQELSDLKARLDELADQQGQTQEAIGFVPKGSNWKLTSNNSNNPGHTHDTDSVTMNLDDLDDVNTITEAQGQLIYRDASAWDALSPGTDGQFLKTQGAGNNPVWADVDNDVTDINLTAGEAISANDAVVLGPEQYGEDILLVADNTGSEVDDNTSEFGKTSNQVQVGIVIGYDDATLPANFKKFKIQLRKKGSPTDNVTFSVQRDDGTGDPDGVSLADATYDGSTLTTSFAEIELTLDNIVTIDGVAKDYMIVMSRSGSQSDVNYYQFGKLTADNNGDIDTLKYTGGSWTASSHDPTQLEITPYLGADKVYQAKSDDTSRLNFIGFATDAAAKDATCTVRTKGRLTGFTGLSKGAVYLIGTAGSISNTPAGEIVRVGIALSATEVFIVPEHVIRTHHSQTTFASADLGSSTTIYCGFRPKMIFGRGALSQASPMGDTIFPFGFNVSSSQEDAAHNWVMVGWVDGTHAGFQAGDTDTDTSGANSTTYLIRGDTSAGSQDFGVKIENITDISFDLTFEKIGHSDGITVSAGLDLFIMG